MSTNYSFYNYVAVVDNNVLGIVHYKSKKFHNSKSSSKIRPLYLIKHYGLFRSLISGLSLLSMHYSIPKNELYVDFIAVHPDCRGQGIGNELLDFGEKLGISMTSISTYSLRVIGKNTGARRLYEKKGFKVINSKKKYISRLFSHVGIYHKMIKPLL